MSETEVENEINNDEKESEHEKHFALELQTCNEILNFIGYGLYQVRILFISVFGFGILDSDLSLMSGCFSEIRKEWNVNYFTFALLPSVCSAAKYVGSVVGFQVAQKYGRLVPFRLGCDLAFVFNLVSILLGKTFFSFVLLRLLVSFFIGMNDAVENDVLKESCGRKFKGFLNANRFLAPVFGSFFLFVLESFDLPWRLLCFTFYLPCLISSFLRYLYVDETPYWLIENGKKTEAKKLLEKIQKINTGKDSTLNFEGIENSLKQQPKSKTWKKLKIMKIQNVFKFQSKIFGSSFFLLVFPTLITTFSMALVTSSTRIYFGEYIKLSSCKKAARKTLALAMLTRCLSNMLVWGLVEKINKLKILQFLISFTTLLYFLILTGNVFDVPFLVSFGLIASDGFRSPISKVAKLFFKEVYPYTFKGEIGNIILLTKVFSGVFLPFLTSYFMYESCPTCFMSFLVIFIYLAFLSFWILLDKKIKFN